MDVKISLRAARVNIGMNQETVAKKIGVSPRTVCSWENGKTCPTGDVLFALCGMYNIPVDNIILPKK